MQLSANIEVLYYELPWEERFAAAKADGFNYVEFWGWQDKNLEQVKKLLKDNDLDFSCMSGDGPYSMCDPASKEEYLDYIKQAIEAAKIINCPNLVIHSDSLEENPQYAIPLSGDYSNNEKLLNMFSILQTISKWAEEAGITFVLEALNDVTDHLGNFLTSTKVSSELVTATNSDNMKILYDVYHMYLTQGRITETVQNYIKKIGYIHIADAPGRHEPGTGIINYKFFCEYLKKLNYKGFVGFKLYPKESTKSALVGIKEAFGSVI